MELFPLRLFLLAVIVLLLDAQAEATSNVTLATRPTSSLRSSQTASATSLPPSNHNGSAIYRPLFAQHRDDTPRFTNATGENVNPLVPAAIGLSKRTDSSNKHTGAPYGLSQRDTTALAEGACAPGTPCVNGACCSKDGWCGYSPNFCGAGNCISNCDAKASCGQYAAPGHGACPLNVCCSSSGFCGTTDEFCGATCDNTFGGCGYPRSPSCSSFSGSTSRRRIGYYEGWAPTRPCDQRAPEDLQTAGLTHINFAFAFFNPSTFQMSGMDAETVTLYSRFTALKARQPGLQTWISVGGWSFNDPTNVPNTRTAFSDMVSTAANRAAFITSLKQFMATYNFDGVDIDWEYPGADDRGGVPVDTANFVKLLKEMRASFGGRYGISATLPSSYWYLQHFDLPGMQQYLDWFNVMTYDIHGVWDSSNIYAGPYVRPHTNLTEIDEGLQLLWRVGINPSKVTLGLGWYGRSFTLSDPSCNRPWCLFSGGGAAGKCTGESGILSNSEILRQIAAGNLIPQVDITAAVAWVSWDDQWVSYDNAETVQLKLKYANSKCLGGTMIWAIDLDDGDGTSLGSTDPNLHILSSHQCLTPNLCPGNPISPRSIYDTAAGETACYTSFCNAGCAVGYTEVSRMNGLIGYLNFDTTCPPGQFQSLCCADGTTYSTCKWEGYRGLGLSCSGGCGDGVFSDVTEVAQNTNRHDVDTDSGFLVDQTCNGGYMSYCCTDFLPPPGFTQDFNLLGQDTNTRVVDLSTVVDPEGELIADVLLCPDTSLLVTSGAAVVLDGAGILQPNSIYKRSSSGTDTFFICFVVNQAPKKLKTIKGSAGPSKQKAKLGIGPVLPRPNKKPNTVGPGKIYGQWTKVSYPAGTTDCQVTYTCKYGGYTTNTGVLKLFDQVCDNQRYYIENVSPNGNKVFNLAIPYPGDNRPQVNAWKNAHHGSYRGDWQISNGIARCDMDEFPLNALQERALPQALRALDRGENGAQGVDFKQWKTAVWQPCSSLRAANKIKPPEPPITWTWAGIGVNDPRSNPSGIIRKYGFDSSSANLCFATYTKDGAQTVVSDHGFRVASTDPLFNPLTINDSPITWTNQWRQWRVNPNNLPSGGVNLPVNVASVAPWLRRREVKIPSPESLGLNDTEASELLLKRKRSQFYLDDEKRELCHKLDLWVSEDELATWEANLNEFCANAITTDSSPSATLGNIPSANTRSDPNPTTTLLSRQPSGFMTVTQRAVVAESASPRQL